MKFFLLIIIISYIVQCNAVAAAELRKNQGDLKIIAFVLFAIVVVILIVIWIPKIHKSRRKARHKAIYDDVETVHSMQTNDGSSSARLESESTTSRSSSTSMNSMIGLAGRLIISPPPTRATSRRTTDTSVFSASQQGRTLINFVIRPSQTRNSQNSNNLITIPPLVQDVLGAEPPPPYKP